MPLRIIIGLVRLVIVLITFECITPAFASAYNSGPHEITIHTKAQQGSFLSFIFEKSEEEKSEEARDKFMLVELIDFSQLATLLSQEHTPHISIIPFEHRFDIKPSMFKLFCVFII
jgi:hypothetical protein